MELWNQYQYTLGKNMNMERLLSILEAFAEDLLFKESGHEIEIIEKVIQVTSEAQQLALIQSQGPQLSENEQSSYQRTRAMSSKQAVRMSIFTIDEENDDDDEESSQSSRLKASEIE